MAIYLTSNVPHTPLRLDALEKTVGMLLDAIDESEASVSVSFVGDEESRQLNREHRGKDRPTDVLSFPLYEPEELRAEPDSDAERLLGDIVISIDTAQRQAQEYDATLEAEIERLLIHGLLHLMGHDHEEPEERERMEAEERRLAAAIGMVWPYA